MFVLFVFSQIKRKYGYKSGPVGREICTRAKLYTVPPKPPVAIQPRFQESFFTICLHLTSKKVFRIRCL